MEILKILLKDPALTFFEKFPGLAEERSFSAGEVVPHSPDKFSLAIIFSGKVKKILKSADAPILVDILVPGDSIVFAAIIRVELPAGKKLELVSDSPMTRIFYFSHNKSLLAAIEAQQKIARDFLNTGNSQPAKLAAYLRWQSFRKGEEISMSLETPPRLYWIVSGSCQNRKIFGPGSIIGVDDFFELRKAFRSSKKYAVISDMVVLVCDSLGAKLAFNFWGPKKFRVILTGESTYDLRPAAPAAVKDIYADGSTLAAKARATAEATLNFQAKVNGLVIILFSTDPKMKKIFMQALFDAPVRLIVTATLEESLEISKSVPNLVSIRLFVDPRILNLEISSALTECVDVIGDPDQVFILPGAEDAPGILKNFQTPLTAQAVAKALINL